MAESKAWANQAYRYGDNAYGFQFHLEVDEALVHRWLSTPRYLKELSSLKGRTDPETIRRETTLYIEELKALSQNVFGSFLDLIKPSKESVSMASR